MNQSQDSKRHANDQKHHSEVGSQKVEVERNRSVNHLPTETVSNNELKQIDKETDALMSKQGPASLRREGN